MLTDQVYIFCNFRLTKNYCSLLVRASLKHIKTIEKGFISPYHVKYIETAVIVLRYSAFTLNCQFSCFSLLNTTFFIFKADSCDGINESELVGREGDTEGDSEVYSGLRAQDLQEAKDQLLVETADMLHIPLFTAEALLRDNGKCNVSVITYSTFPINLWLTKYAYSWLNIQYCRVFLPFRMVQGFASGEVDDQCCTVL